MKNQQLKKYRLQTQMEQLKPGNEQFFTEYLKEVLESNKPYYEKADYIASSIESIQDKIDYINNEIKELQTLKKSLELSKQLALETTALVLNEYGIDKLEGAVISSLTITPQSSKTKEKLIIKDDNATMALGFVKFSVDEEAILKALQNNNNEAKELQEYVKVESTVTTIPAKVKINHKRSSNNGDLLEHSKQVA